MDIGEDVKNQYYALQALRITALELAVELYKQDYENGPEKIINTARSFIDFVETGEVVLYETNEEETADKEPELPLNEPCDRCVGHVMDEEPEGAAHEPVELHPAA
jgi:hypothetical protein